MTYKWYVIRTKPQSESIAATALSTGGFEFFLPIVQVPDPDSGQKKLPLFPGYMFLRHDADENDWPSLNQLSGVLDWVRLGDEVPSVPDETVTELSNRIDMINREGGLWNRFQPGQKVRVVSDTIEGLAKVVDQPHSPEARVKVLLEFMGRQVMAKVPWHSLQPLTHVDERKDTYKKPRRTRGRGRWIRGAAQTASAGA